MTYVEFIEAAPAASRKKSHATEAAGRATFAKRGERLGGPDPTDLAHDRPRPAGGRARRRRPADGGEDQDFDVEELYGRVADCSAAAPIPTTPASKWWRCSPPSPSCSPTRSAPRSPRSWARVRRAALRDAAAAGAGGLTRGGPGRSGPRRAPGRGPRSCPRRRTPTRSSPTCLLTGYSSVIPSAPQDGCGPSGRCPGPSRTLLSLPTVHVLRS